MKHLMIGFLGMKTFFSESWILNDFDSARHRLLLLIHYEVAL